MSFYNSFILNYQKELFCVLNAVTVTPLCVCENLHNHILERVIFTAWKLRFD